MSRLAPIRLDARWAIVRLAPDAAIPGWASTAVPFVSVTRTDDELSIVAPADVVPESLRAERDFALLRIDGSVPLDSVGVLARLATPLAAKGISLSVIATFDTDYLLIRERLVDAAIAELRAAGIGVK